MSIQLSRFIDITGVLSDVKNKIIYYSTRPDVPTLAELNLTPEEKARVPDLLVSVPNWERCADNKHNVSEYLPLSDMFRGTILPSPSVLLLQSLLPVLAMISTLLFLAAKPDAGKYFYLIEAIPVFGSVFIAASIRFSLASNRDAAGVWWNAYLAPSCVAAFVASHRTASSGGLGDVIYSAATVGAEKIGMIVLLCIAILGLGLLAGRGQKLDAIVKTVRGAFVFIAVASIAFVFAQFFTFFGFLFPFLAGIAWGPVRFAKEVLQQRMQTLSIQSSRYNGSTGITENVENEKAVNKAKIIAAAKDKSPVFDEIRSLGVFYAKGSSRGCPKNAMLRFTMASIDTHISVLGETKGGKTSSMGIPLISTWIGSGHGGTLLLDGKMELPLFFRGVRNFQLIDETTPLSPFEGLDEQGIIQAVLSVSNVDSRKSDGGNSQHFKMQGIIGFSCAVYLMFAMSEAEKMAHAFDYMYGPRTSERPKRKWTITPNSLRKILISLGSWDSKGWSPVAEYLNYIVKWHPELKHVKRVLEDGSFTTDVLYETPKSELIRNQIDVAKGYGKMGETERGSVFSTINGWILPMFTSEKLLHWCSRESGGYNIEKVLYGASAGFYLPREIFGEAGLIFQALVKHRLMTCIKRRTKGWEQRFPNQKPVLLLMDEYQSLASDEDFDLTSKGRSWGLTVAILMQSRESLIAMKGREWTDALLQNIKTNAWFRNADSPITMQAAIRTIGKGFVKNWIRPQLDLSMYESAKLAASMPIHDPTHPDHGFYEQLQRMGGGQFLDSYGGSQTTLSEIHHSNHADDDVHAVLRASLVPQVTKNTLKEEDLLLEAEWQEYLAKKGRVIIQYQRGGVVMTELGECGFMEYPPKELTGPDTIPDSIVDSEFQTEERLAA